MTQMPLSTDVPRYTPDELDQFKNLAGQRGVDEQIKNELRAADIVIQDFPVIIPGEVNTGVFGTLHGWKFTRAWQYWVCEGPGLDLAYANWLSRMAGGSARVGGDCTGPKPVTVYKGLGCGLYHCDTPFSLRMLTRAINTQVEQASTANYEAPERNDRPLVKIPEFPLLAAVHVGLFECEGVLRIQRIDETAAEGFNDAFARQLVCSLAGLGRTDALTMLQLDGRAVDDPYLEDILQSSDATAPVT